MPKPPTESFESQTFSDSQQMVDSGNESMLVYEDMPEPTIENIDKYFEELYNTDKKQLYKWFQHQREKMDLGNKNFKRVKRGKKKVVKSESRRNISQRDLKKAVTFGENPE